MKTDPRPDRIAYVEAGTLDTYVALMDQALRWHAVRQFALGALVGAALLLVSEALETRPPVCGVPRVALCAALLGVLSAVMWGAHRRFRTHAWKATALRPVPRS